MSSLRDETVLLATAVVRRPHGASGVGERDSPSSTALDWQLAPMVLHLPSARSSIHRLWLVRAALAPAKRITRAAWPDSPGAAVDSGPSPCGFGGPRDSQ